MNCPACKQPLANITGTQMDQHLPEDKRDGVTVYCPNRNCGPQEVAGHAGNVNAAFKIIEQKFNRKFQANEE